MEIRIEEYKSLTPEILNSLDILEKDIFEKPYPTEKIEREFKTKSNGLILLAFFNNELAGYKVGYQLSSHLYYSWIGGVRPSLRGHGIAKALMDKQHQIVSQMGYKTIQTHTENQYKPMLILNLKSGFNIVGTLAGERYQNLKIVLEKAL